MIYGGFKNVPIFGKDGILSQSISTGRLVAGTPTKQSFTAPGIVEPPIGEMLQNPVPNKDEALNSINQRNRALGNRLGDELTRYSNNPNATDAGALVGLIRFADASGYHDEAAALSAYVSSITKGGVQ
jgi:hypothetical protein